MSEVDIKQLFEAGAHFGHKVSRWNPKMNQYIYGKKDGTHIINLDLTVSQLKVAQEFLTDVAGRGRQILFVGTKKQAKDIAKSVAESVDMPYVVERWLGGMLTNSSTILSQIKRLKLLEKRIDSGELANHYNKLEVQRFQEEVASLNVKYGGIKELHGKPGAVFVLDAVANHNAVVEAHKLNIPVVAICDTNADPTDVDYVIPANDDAIDSLQLISSYVADAIKAGASVAAKRSEERKVAAEKEAKAKESDK